MPAKSKAQAIVMRIAEHHPEKLYERNKGLASMSQESLHEFASTKEKSLPYRVHKEKKKSAKKRKTYGE